MARLPAAAACALLACFLLASCAGAGNLLGCYRVSKAQRRVSSPQACRQLCTSRKMPIYIYDWKKGCACTATIPRKGARISSGLCKARRAKTAQYFYVHTAPGGCFLNPKPLQPKHWNTDWLASNVAFQGSNQVTLTSQGATGPVLTMNGGPQQYGYFTIKMKAAGPMAGPVTAAYWTSELGNDRSSLDEIDVEIINSFRSVNNGGCLWTHHYKNGISYLERMFCPAEVQRIARLPYQPQPWTAARTYGVDWQPTYIRWYVDGRLVHSRDYWDSNQVPTKPMFMRLSTWAWNTQPNCTFFAGCTYDQGARYSSTLSDALLVTCK